MDYTKSIPWGEFQTWVEREFEAIERAFGQRNIPRWDDLRFAAGSISINPIGTVDAPTPVAVETTFPATLSFSGSADNLIAGVAQMPHAWKGGTEIHPHIHWTKPTASASEVTWEFYYRMIGNVGDTAGSWLGPFTGVIQSGNVLIANRHILSSFDAIDMTGYTDSAMLSWRLYRRGSTDADNNAVFLFELDFHYQTDVPGGSIVEYPTSSPFNQEPSAGSLVITGYAPTVTKT